MPDHDELVMSHAGRRLSYRKTGTGPAVLLLHGLGSGARDWEPQTLALAGRFTVIAPDLRGHGISSPASGAIDIAEQAADMATLLMREGIDRADVVGMSMGGAIALQMALDFPERVRSLTVVNSRSAFAPRSWRERLTYWQRLLIVRLLGLPRLGRILAGRLFPDQPGLQAWFIERFGDNDQTSYLAALRGLAAWSVVHRLGEIRCPTLIVAADQDYTPLQDKRDDCARIPGARLAVIEDARHAVTVERPQAFNAVLLSFLDGETMEATA